MQQQIFLAVYATGISRRVSTTGHLRNNSAKCRVDRNRDAFMHPNSRLLWHRQMSALPATRHSLVEPSPLLDLCVEHCVSMHCVVETPEVAPTSPSPTRSCEDIDPHWVFAFIDPRSDCGAHRINWSVAGARLAVTCEVCNALPPAWIMVHSVAMTQRHTHIQLV